MERSISEVARMTGLTSRTLRHYDQIGLLRPARVAGNGYRWYGREELRRLQRILVLRELAVPLPQVAEILDGEVDELASLRRHRAELVGAQRRIGEILDTVDRTIADLEGRESLADEEFFAGLATRVSSLRTDLVQRFGTGVDRHFVAAETATSSWGRAEHEAAAQEGRDLLRRLSRVRRAGAGPSDEQVLDLMAEHYAGVRAMWPADAAAYHALGAVLVEQPVQRAIIDDVDPDLPEWLAEAVRAYATLRLHHTV